MIEAIINKELRRLEALAREHLRGVVHTVLSMATYREPERAVWIYMSMEPGCGGDIEAFASGLPSAFSKLQSAIYARAEQTPTEQALRDILGVTP